MIWLIYIRRRSTVHMGCANDTLNKYVFKSSSKWVKSCCFKLCDLWILCNHLYSSLYRPPVLSDFQSCRRFYCNELISWLLRWAVGAECLKRSRVVIIIAINTRTSQSCSLFRDDAFLSSSYEIPWRTRD